MDLPDDQCLSESQSLIWVIRDEETEDRLDGEGQFLLYRELETIVWMN